MRDDAGRDRARTNARHAGLATTFAGLTFATLLAFAYWWPAFRVPDATGFGDWQMVHHNWEVGLVSLTRHRELPLFDPYHCGGVTLLGNPESQVYSPLFLLALAFGSTLATKIFIALHTAVALAGAAYYAKRIVGLSALASALAAVVFACSGFFAWHLAGGHATFAPFAFLPLLHVALRRGETSPRAAIAGGLLLALTVAEGGTYPFPYMLVSLALAGLTRVALDPATLWPVLRGGSAMGIVSLAVAAFRIGPIRETLARLPRTIGSTDSSSFSDVFVMLTARDHEWGVAGHEFVWPEYCTFVGYGVLAFVVVGVLRGARRPQRRFAFEHVLGALVAVLLIQGNASGFHPWVLLRHLPVFDSLRVPSRFAVTLTFHLGVLAGMGLDVLDARPFEGRRRAALLALAGIALLALTVDIVAVTRPIVDRWTSPAIDGSVVARELHYGPPNAYGEVYASLPRRNEATTLCYVGGMNWAVSPSIRVGDVAQAWTDSPEARATLVRRTPSRAIIAVDSPHATRVFLNQNYDPGFRSSAGRVVDVLGLLAVEVPPRVRAVEVRYEPRSLAPSFALAAFSLLLSTVALVRASRWPTFRAVVRAFR